MRPQTHGPGLPKPPASRGDVMELACQPSSTSSCRRCGLFGARHSTRGICTVPAPWPEVRLAQAEAAELCVRAAQHQPWPWGSPSRSCALCQRGAGASALLRLTNATCWGWETSGLRSRNPGSGEHVQKGQCGCWEHRVAPSIQPAGFGPRPAQDVPQRRCVASSATSRTEERELSCFSL